MCCFLQLGRYDCAVAKRNWLNLCHDFPFLRHITLNVMLSALPTEIYTHDKTTLTVNSVMSTCSYFLKKKKEHVPIGGTKSLVKAHFHGNNIINTYLMYR